MSNSLPLDISLNLAGVSTAAPMIADGQIVHVRFANGTMEVKEKGKMLKFEYHLLEPAPTSDGNQLKPGFPLFEYITLYGKDTPPGEVPEWAQKKISRIIDAFLGTGDVDNKAGRPTRPDFNADTLAKMIGAEAYAKMKIGKDDDGNPRSNISQIINPADMATA